MIMGFWPLGGVMINPKTPDLPAWRPAWSSSGRLACDRPRLPRANGTRGHAGPGQGVVYCLGVFQEG